MRLLVIVALLPLFSLASPVNSSSDGLSIPLFNRATLKMDGVANMEALLGQMAKAHRKLQLGFKAYEKNTGATHPMGRGTAGAHLEIRATGSVKLQDVDNVLWQGALAIGTPPKSYVVDFDTGSSDLFLPDGTCGITCVGHHKYDPRESSTARALFRQFSLLFGDGSTVKGSIFRDTVTVGGLTATGQAVGAASEYSKSLSASTFSPDGLMGMGFPQISSYNEPPFFNSLIKQGKTTASTFAFKLAQTGSELFLGGTNTALYTGPITYVPLTTVGYWEVKMDGVVVGGKTLGGHDAIIDTGTSLIVGDLTSVAEFYAQIPGSKSEGSGLYSIPCKLIPTVSLKFGGKAFPIPTANFNLGLVAAGSSQCVGGLTSQEKVPFWIVGDVFLQSVYSIYDVGKTRVGFAKLA